MMISSTTAPRRRARCSISVPSPAGKVALSWPMRRLSPPARMTRLQPLRMRRAYRRLLSDRAADVAEDVGHLVAQDDQQHDHDHRDQDQDQCVLDHSLAPLTADRTSPAKYMPALSVTDLSQSVTGPLQKKTGARAGLFLSWLPRNDQEGETEDEAEGASEGAFDAGLMMVVLPPPAPNQC